MVESIIRGLKGVSDLQGPLQASIWDQGDAVGAWIGDKIVAVVFPTPETLPQVCHTQLVCKRVSVSVRVLSEHMRLCLPSLHFSSKVR